MSLLAYRFVRAIVLGLMFFLAVTASCSTDSYDPDPYDNTPPVVSIEFNYVIPSRVSLRRPGAQAKSRQHAAFRMNVAPASLVPVVLLEPSTVPAMQQGSPQLVMPLRR